MRKILMAVGGAVIALYVGVILMFHGEGAVVYLSVEEPEALREVFASGEPWLVWCSDSASQKDDVSAIHSVVTNAAPLLKRHATVGILDCSAELPSGKTTYEKAGLDAKLKPVLFLSANGQKPTQIKPKYAASAEALTVHVSEKAKPVLRRPTSPDHLKSGCLSRKWCALVLTDGKPTGDTKEHLDHMVRSFRSVSFSSVDARKYRLSTTPKVLTKFEPKPDRPTMLLLHKTKIKGKPVLLAKKYNEGDIDADGGAGDVIEQALAAGTVDDKETLKAGGWTKISAAVNLKYKRGSSRVEDEPGEEEFELIDEGEEEAEDKEDKEEEEGDESGQEEEEGGESAAGDGGGGGEEASSSKPKKPKGAKAERIAQLKTKREARIAAEAAETKAKASAAAESAARARERARREAMDREAEKSADFIDAADEGDAEEGDEEAAGGDDDADEEDEILMEMEDEDEDEGEDEGAGGDGDAEEEVVLLDDWDDDEL
eukprot:SAG22_NODE_345_length_11911_cov_15.741217_8_plen_487_part_00